MEFWQKLLSDTLSTRKRRNTRYSLRALSRDLEIEVSVLSRVLKGERKLSAQQAVRVADRLRLPENERRRLFASLGGEAARWAEAKVHVLQDELARLLLADWRYYAILNVLKLNEGTKKDTRWIARRLGIEQREAEDLIQRLLYIGFIRVGEQGGLERVVERLDTAPEADPKAIQAAHRNHLELATRALIEIPKAKRLFFLRTFAGSSAKIEAAQKAITDLRSEVSRNMEAGDLDEVYVLGVQLIPLLRPKD